MSEPQARRSSPHLSAAPFLRRAELRSQTISNLGRGDYSSAQTSFDSIATVLQESERMRLAQEKKRQSGEKINLEKAYAIEKERFAAEWAKKMDAVDARCEQKLRELAETHEVARAVRCSPLPV